MISVSGHRRSFHLVMGALAVTLCAVSVSGFVAETVGASARLAIPATSHTIDVVAAENFWGSIASQVGGSHVVVHSIIVNPNTDPHSYEPTPSDGRTISAAQIVIVNGVGYDPWATSFLAANPAHQSVLNVGSLLRLSSGDNPHRWYNPSDVAKVIKQITSDFSSVDHSDARYFAARAQAFTTKSLASYRSLIATIKQQYGGTPVGASESIFSMLAPSLGLHLITPPTFLRAISEGGEVSAKDKATIDRQITQHKIVIYVYNSQNATPDVAEQLALCKKEHIPTATITETLSPENASYESWQVRQLRGILAALKTAKTAA